LITISLGIIENSCYNLLLQTVKGTIMARITSQEAGRVIGSLYDLVLIASRRVRELRNGHAPMVEKRYGDLVTALSEIEEGKVGRDYLLKNPNLERENRRKSR
jgi:DNA-directed RNA polymerase subunit omega